MYSLYSSMHRMCPQRSKKSDQSVVITANFTHRDLLPCHNTASFHTQKLTISLLILIKLSLVLTDLNHTRKHCYLCCTNSINYTVSHKPCMSGQRRGLSLLIYINPDIYAIVASIQISLPLDITIL